MKYDLIEGLKHDEILSLYDNVIEDGKESIAWCYFCWTNHCNDGTIRYYCQWGGWNPGEYHCFDSTSWCGTSGGRTCTYGYEGYTNCVPCYNS